jgi:colanic acid biosynthesis glycosyl transferase WcaI
VRIVFINRYYRPDQSATSQLCSELTESLAEAGMEVIVITSRQLLDDPDADLKAREILSGVSVQRVWTSSFGRNRLLGRSFDYLSFYILATLRLLRITSRNTVVVAMTDPPLIGVLAAWVARVRGARHVNWLQDFFPEVAQRLGVLKSAQVNAILRVPRNWSLRTAARNIAIGERMAVMVAGITGHRPTVIPNWALEEGNAADAAGLRATWKLEGKFVVGYSGNMGRAHRLDVLINAAALLQQDTHVMFLLVGDGAQRARLEARVRELRLDNVQFQPFQPRERLRESLSLPDIHVVSLDSRLEGLIVPSKFVGVVALGKPVLWLGDTQGELGQMVRETGCGVVANGDDAGDVASVIRSLDAQRLGAMSAAASLLWKWRFRRRQALDDWLTLLQSLA